VIALVFVGVLRVPLTHYGWMTGFGPLTYGIGYGTPFALTRYRNHRLPIILIAGALATILKLALPTAVLGNGLARALAGATAAAGWCHGSRWVVPRQPLARYPAGRMRNKRKRD
jgi:hypothetical protein